MLSETYYASVLLLFLGPVLKNSGACLLHATLDTSAFFGSRQEVATFVSNLELVVTSETVLDVIQGHGVVGHLLVQCYPHLGQSFSKSLLISIDWSRFAFQLLP